MLNKLKPKSEFSRNVLTLMTGTTIAQAIPIAISPILTRIYTPENFGVFAQYSVRVKNRDRVQAKLKEIGILTAVHYPMPLHLQECFGYLGYSKGDFLIAKKVSKEIMSLPMNPYVSDEEIDFITKGL